MPENSVEQLAINTIRTLAMDAVQAANSGHPGTPMALAPAAMCCGTSSSATIPPQPDWPNRDRFVLSCGHASMLLYSRAAPGGREAIGRRRPARPASRPCRWSEFGSSANCGSRCPGHPEHGHTSGVETTTGPLGQGIGNSVGMAIASRWLAARYNRPGFDLFDFNVYAFCSDGDMMEGVGGEAASLAGHLKLSNLCWLYDDNHITIEGHTSLAFSEDVATRFAGYGWNVVWVATSTTAGPAQAWSFAIGGRRGSRPGRTAARDAKADPDDGMDVRRRPAHADHRSQRDRLRLAAQGQHGRGPRRAAGRGGSPADEGRLRLAGEREVPGAAARCRAHFRDGIGARGEKLYADWTAKFAQYQVPVSRSGRRTGDDRPPRAAGGLGRRHPARFPPTPRAWPAGSPRARCSTRRPSRFPGCWAARPIWPPRPTRC